MVGSVVGEVVTASEGVYSLTTWESLLNVERGFAGTGTGAGEARRGAASGSVLEGMIARSE